MLGKRREKERRLFFLSSFFLFARDLFDVDFLSLSLSFLLTPFPSFSLSYSLSSPSLSLQQYLYALNQTIQVAGVSVLLDAVVAALAENEDRTFTYGEIAFFSRWWREASGAQRETVRSLVLGSEDETGNQQRRRSPPQLSFVNGGWVQHDEACAFWEDMVDQTSRGHSWLADAFGDLGVIPTVGWQIDPFGHSATHADLLVAGAGMDAVFFGRADQQDLGLRARAGDLEVVWEGGDDDDDSGGGEGGDGGGGNEGDEGGEGSFSSRGVLAGTFASGNYGPPPGFNWVRSWSA